MDRRQTQKRDERMTATKKRIETQARVVKNGWAVVKFTSRPAPLDNSEVPDQNTYSLIAIWPTAGAKTLAEDEARRQMETQVMHGEYGAVFAVAIEGVYHLETPLQVWLLRRAQNSGNTTYMVRVGAQKNQPPGEVDELLEVFLLRANHTIPIPAAKPSNV